ncbi:MAG: phosphoribosylamine--glycine ligase, partial [Pseudomonadota bacterium]|nr:phosphoribosylamine--glycine ligase [Pseudomonadota bacterium]
FGDPETQVMMMRLKSDVLELLWASAHSLKGVTAKWDERFALTVVLAAKGYPGEYQKGNPIKGLNQDFEKDVEVFHAGTALQGEQIVSNGGRVLNVTALGATVTEAQRKAYTVVDKIDWEGGFCRRDIGWRAVTK